MKPNLSHLVGTGIFVGGYLICTVARLAAADAISADLQHQIDASTERIRQWAQADVIVQAVKAQNAGASSDITQMTETKWTSLTVLDPTVRAFEKSAAGKFLKASNDELVSEAFISDASGRKVAFLAKTTWFCHRGKAKHDQPMQGKPWQGPIEVDESSGVRQVQVSVPILDGQTPIGSLVVGLNISRMTEQH